VVPGPAFSDLLLDDAELEAGCARFLQVAIQGGAGEDNAVELLEKQVDRGMGALGLFFFELDGIFHHFGGGGPGIAPVLAALSGKGIESLRAIEVEFSPEGGKGGLSGTSSGKDHLLLGEFF